MTAAANSQRRRAARLGSVLFGVCLPALLWAAPAAKPAAKTPHPARALAPAASDSLLGIALGMDLNDVHGRLQALGTSGSGDAAGGKDEGVGEAKPAAPDEDADAGHQEVWTLRGTSFARVAFATDDKNKVVWITGFVRPGQGIPFAKLGDLARASARTDSRALWNVIRPHDLYRVMVGGKDGKASVVSLISLHPANPNGIFSPQIVPGGGDGTKK